jgi:hypothetical protein
MTSECESSSSNVTPNLCSSREILIEFTYAKSDTFFFFALENTFILL